MNPDDIVVVFANPKDAQVIVGNDPEMADSLIISTMFPEGEVLVAPRDEFMEWMTGASDEQDI